MLRGAWQEGTEPPTPRSHAELPSVHKCSARRSKESSRSALPTELSGRTEMFLFCNDTVQSTGKGAKRSSETETLVLLNPN